MNLWAIVPIIYFLLDFNSSHIYHLYTHGYKAIFFNLFLPIDNTTETNKQTTKIASIYISLLDFRDIIR